MLYSLRRYRSDKVAISRIKELRRKRYRRDRYKVRDYTFN